MLAVIPEFGLRVFQSPSGNDLAALQDSLSGAGDAQQEPDRAAAQQSDRTIRTDASVAGQPSEQAHEQHLDDDHAQEHADGVDRGV